MTRFFAAFLLASIAFAFPAQAERRVALVMGNGLYKHAVGLPNPPADAKAMGSMLRSLGFEVVEGTDLSREQMNQSIGKFAEVSGGADVALFFYAGHAIQLEGRNLLVPVDAEITSEFEAKQRTVEIDAVLQYTMADAKVKLVLLDGCRNNPFAKQIASTAPKTRNVVLGAGLAEMKPGKGTLIAFATGPGQVALDGEGLHSPFTSALLQHMPSPGLEIGLALKLVSAKVSEDTRERQQPWSNTNMTGFFYMKPADAAPAAQVASAGDAARAPVASTVDDREFDKEFWSSVKSSSNVDDFKAYLTKFPNGIYADLARNRIAALTHAGPGSGPAPGGTQAGSTVPAAVPGDTAPASGDIRTAEASKATEDALGLNVEGWKEVQRRLSGLTFKTGGTDGRVGDGTRRAIGSWQSARNYPSTQYLNRLQYESLMKEQLVTAPTSASSESRSVQPRRSTQGSEGGGNGKGGMSAGDAAAAIIIMQGVKGVMRNKGFGF